MRRRPVRGATVDLIRRGDTLHVHQVEPTAERIAKGDLHSVYRRNISGHLTRVERAMTPGLVDQLQLAGEIGENVPRLLAAATWFIEQAECAQLRGRMVQSQLSGPPEHGQGSARRALLQAYDWLGLDSFNALYDALVWEIMPRGPDRRALFRAALHALARALNAETPPTK